MKVKQLISLLEQQNPEADVIIEDAVMSASLSVESGNEVTKNYHRVKGIEKGFGCVSQTSMSFDLDFTVASPEPLTDGVPVIRIVGVSSEPTPINQVRRRVGLGLSWITQNKENNNA